MADKTKIIEKISKLIALCENNPNSEEAKAASAKAFALMREHGLKYSDILEPKVVYKEAPRQETYQEPQQPKYEPPKQQQQNYQTTYTYQQNNYKQQTQSAEPVQNKSQNKQTFFYCYLALLLMAALYGLYNYQPMFFKAALAVVGLCLFVRYWAIIASIIAITIFFQYFWK